MSEKPPTFYANDLSEPDLALTKEQHDRYVEARGRNYTDTAIRRRSTKGTTTTPGAFDATEGGQFR